MQMPEGHLQLNLGHFIRERPSPRVRGRPRLHLPAGPAPHLPPGPPELPIRMEHRPMFRQEGGRQIIGPQFEELNCGTAISSVNRCLTKHAKELMIYDIGYKLKHPEVYDIGGTYADEEPPETAAETWFFISTTICLGNNYLVNLFVCHRKTGNFAVGISSGNEINHKKTEKSEQSRLPDNLTWYTFRSAQPNENFHIKTFCFSKSDLKALDMNTLVIPISIETNTATALNNDVIKRIKLNHDFGDILNKPHKTDFVLTCATEKQFPVHKIFLAAHSPVLREIIKRKSSNDAQAFIDISESDMEWLLEFIYTGTIKDILKKDCIRLLQLADQFKLSNLFFLTQFALGDQINIENAVDIACISEHYKLDKLQNIVFNFIKNNPKVLETEGWKNLDDVNLAKKLFQFMHTKRD